jgi:hypothetical protein
MLIVNTIKLYNIDLEIYKICVKKLVKQDSIRAEPKRAQWSKQEYTTEEIIKQCSLPQIVKCSGGAISPQLAI